MSTPSYCDITNDSMCGNTLPDSNSKTPWVVTDATLATNCTNKKKSDYNQPICSNYRGFQAQQAQIAAEKAAAAKAAAAQAAADKAADKKLQAAATAAQAQATSYINEMKKNTSKEYTFLKTLVGSSDGKTIGIEKSDQSTIASRMAKIPPSPPTLDASTMTMDDIRTTINSIEKNYKNAFSFIKVAPNPSAIDEYHVKCIAPSEDSTTPAYSMKQIDNNYHTRESCKLNAAIQGYKYHALVKPDPSSNPIQANLYQCYGSNDAIPSPTSYFDYETIWSMGPNVSSFGLDTSGELVITYIDGTTTYLTQNASYVAAQCSVPNSCSFQFNLLDNGNFKLFKITNPYQVTVTELFELDKTVLSKLANIAPLSNPDWKTSALSSGNTLALGENIPNTRPYLISASGIFKLEINNGVLQLKTSVYACTPVDTSKTSQPIYTTTSSNKAQSYYVYQNWTGEPGVNKIYQAINGPDTQILQNIPSDSTRLTLSNNYSQYAGYFPMANDTKSSTFDSVAKCKKNCNNDPTCKYFYSFSDSNGNTTCALGSNDNPSFAPNQTDPINKTSTLYIREPKVTLDQYDNNMNTLLPNVDVKTSTLPYANYSIDGSGNANGPYGIASLSQYKSLKQRDSAFFNGTGKQGFINRKNKKTEGFNNYGYNTPSANCSTDISSDGCKNAILNGQIQPLQSIASDYTSQINKISSNYYDISNNIQTYYKLYPQLNNNAIYDFNKDQDFQMEPDTLTDQMNKDTRAMALQQNNMYVAGSILTATLLITAIYLAR